MFVGTFVAEKVGRLVCAVGVGEVGGAAGGVSFVPGAVCVVVPASLVVEVLSSEVDVIVALLMPLVGIKKSKLVSVWCNSKGFMVGMNGSEWY